ncbi:TPA: helix-turn-helix domain-containing protein [Klebsiella pneumoniae]|uniref:helix-turn-helix domain-containing protein n=1 Tax=Klebsiella pneumoniae TaxID=573 RepID=UPI00164846BD|nr:helix-turn-helix transcriptional regulator [Klebsiella pneumoniae]EKW2891918.1 helix-turn-helix domain-containing protein [Klebsiella pneumoniae]ELA0627873.1 helix-turn-helix domain-containing protein [Klebsiella pneumoniae]MBC4125421.1 helix-turn-helix domain-containing protein [Klebsiella pneumoniae]MBX4703643.1 DNA-binding protein [Klebsiella pneumoniae]MCD9656181.1 helix-turn-helix domain-containing protein [Klebsiella pneumoniae]
MSEKNQDMHAEDIKAAIRKRGVTMSQLSRESGLAGDSLRKTLCIHWPKGERIIGDFIGIEPAAIWPSRYPQ